jgi:hypothetical protein
MNLQRIVLDNAVGPYRCHQFVFGDQPALGLGQHRYKFQRLAPDRDRRAAIKQLAIGLQDESSDTIFQVIHQRAFRPTGKIDMDARACATRIQENFRKK